MEPIQESNHSFFNYYLIFRFYIESISFLKDKTTVELFFLNAKSCVHQVRLSVLRSSLSISSYLLPLPSPADFLGAVSNF